MDAGAFGHRGSEERRVREHRSFLYPLGLLRRTDELHSYCHFQAASCIIQRAGASFQVKSMNIAPCYGSLTTKVPSWIRSKKKEKERTWPINCVAMSIFPLLMTTC